MSAVIARLAEPEMNLAAWGVVFGLSIILQSPTTMLLAASTALSKDWPSYRKLRRFTLAISAVMTGLHALIAFTPLYRVVLGDIIGVPAEIQELARAGLMLMTPWSAGTAYRRFQQGVLIRFDQTQVVTGGSLLRLTTDSLVLVTGYLLGTIPGVVVAAGAIIAGVLSEAVYTGLRVRPVRQALPKSADPGEPALTLRAFLDFYIPLALTTLLAMVVQPMVSAALSRMPQPLASLAVWPVVFGLITMWQSVGIGYNEVVIALLDKPQAVRRLSRFTLLVIGAITSLLLVMTATPLALFWFSRVAALPPELVNLAQQGLWLVLPLPGLRVLQSWYQGAIVYTRSTGGITESVVGFLLIAGLMLEAGITWQPAAGLYIGLAAYVVGFVVQTGWLWWRSRPALETVQLRDGVAEPVQPELK